MANNSAIQWTNATWNPTTGCTRVSEECRNCYAATLHKRLAMMGQKKYQQPFETFVEHQSDLHIPLKWKKPKMIFVNSMSDLFHPDCSFAFIKRVFDVMMLADWHIYQILTKRPEIMKTFVQHWLEAKGLTQVPYHIWLGTSCGIAKAIPRIETLKTIPVPIRFVSCEPLLEQINPNFTGIQWVIIGGESGKGFRPVNEEWIASLIQNAREAKAKVFFKQWGGARPTSGGRQWNGTTLDEIPSVTK